MNKLKISHGTLKGFDKRGKITENILIIPEGVRKIEASAFSYNKNIKTIIFPSTLDEIEDEAFEFCESLENIDLSKTKNITIKKYAFFACKKLKEIIFPNDINFIGSYAFSTCEELEKISLNNTNRIACAPFKNCKKLKEIIISKDNEYYSDMGCNIIYDKRGNELIQACNMSIISEGTKGINHNAFEGYIVKEVVLPKTVEIIQANAFACCNIERLILNEGLRRIYNNAFCKNNMELLIIPNSVEEIDERAFDDCKKLKEIIIKGNPAMYEGVTFSRCDNLKNIYATSNELINKSFCIDEHKSIKIKPLTLDALIENNKSFKQINKFYKKQEEQR